MSPKLAGKYGTRINRMLTMKRVKRMNLKQEMSSLKENMTA